MLAAAAKLSDAEASAEMLRIYNDFIIDFCKHYPQRMIGLACLPFGDVEAAAKEVHRVAKMGVKGVELSCSWDMQPMWHPSWNPLWQAINETQLPLHFHTFPSVDPKLRAEVKGKSLLALRYSSICLFQMTLGNILTALVGAAVFERYPNFRVVFGESGIGWIPYVLDRMDYEYQDQYREIKLKLLPSEYWRRQCRATFQFDRIGTKLIEDMGVETLMWGSDYPAPGRDLAGFVGVYREAVRPPAGRGDVQDHLRERRQVLRADQLEPDGRGYIVRLCEAGCRPRTPNGAARVRPRDYVMWIAACSASVSVSLCDPARSDCDSINAGMTRWRVPRLAIGRVIDVRMARTGREPIGEGSWQSRLYRNLLVGTIQTNIPHVGFRIVSVPRHALRTLRRVNRSAALSRSGRTGSTALYQAG